MYILYHTGGKFLIALQLKAGTTAVVGTRPKGRSKNPKQALDFYSQPGGTGWDRTTDLGLMSPTL